MFRIVKASKKSGARLTRLTTLHGTIDGPFFMPIATRGAVKHLTPDELLELGCTILLANTYHLWLQPGASVLAGALGLHRFMGWPGAILTDSGGFQVYSLASFRRVDNRGVTFRDPRSGIKVRLTPAAVVRFQERIGSDIIMVLDDCVGYPVTKQAAASAVARSLAWAKRSRLGGNYGRRRRPLVFGIVQGATYAALRRQAIRELAALGFDGYAIGGLAVGERRETMFEVLAQTLPYLPSDKPRYLMGVGRPEEIIAAVRMGVDLFDCVIPTREARHGRLYVWRGKLRSPRQLLAAPRHKLFYDAVNISNAKFKNHCQPVDRTCRHRCCRTWSAAYLHHLFRTREPLGPRLATIHNVGFYLDLMRTLQAGIRSGVV